MPSAAVIAALRDRRPGLRVAIEGRHSVDLADDSVTHLPDRLAEAVDALGELL